jgi:hypothetical protein
MKQNLKNNGIFGKKIRDAEQIFKKIRDSLKKPGQSQEKTSRWTACLWGTQTLFSGVSPSLGYPDDPGYTPVEDYLLLDKNVYRFVFLNLYRSC